MKNFAASLFIVFFLGATTVFAGPPMKVIYSNTVTTNFKWHWPQQTVRTTGYVQTKPYYYTGRLLDLVTQEDVSKYRHYYQYMTHRNTWGYFFEPGTVLGKKAILGFSPLNPAYQVQRSLSYK